MVKVSPLHSQLFLGAMVFVGVLVAVAWIVLSVIYFRLGYPRSPDWARAVRLSDDIDSAFNKLKTALDDGFEVKHHDSKRLIIEKRFSEPDCVMIFDARREGGPWQRLSVQCLNRRWLNWSVSSGRNW